MNYEKFVKIMKEWCNGKQLPPPENDPLSQLVRFDFPRYKRPIFTFAVCQILNILHHGEKPTWWARLVRATLLLFATTIFTALINKLI
ncbi:MAG: hypothetical protein PHE67_06795 [Campylobacterales bacterium]|nr:hypothetical protein [Campylobacterales bacterium]